MADEFNRPEWWEQSRLFQEMMKRERTPERKRQRGEFSPKELKWTMFGGSHNPGGFNSFPRSLESYITSGYDPLMAPWDEPLFFDEGQTELSPLLGHNMKTGETTEHVRRSTVGNSGGQGRFNYLGHQLHHGFAGPRKNFLQDVAEENKLHNMFGEFVDQRNQWNDETAKRLFLERRSQEDWDNIREYTRDNFGRRRAVNSPAYYSPSEDVVVVPEKEPRNAGDKGWSRGGMAQHEYEHYDQRHQGFNPRQNNANQTMNEISEAAKEIPATIGDIINAASVRRAQGEPVDIRTAPVEFPGATQDADMMSRWAYEHGYNQPEGPSLTELIYGTPEGRKWLKTMAGPGEPYPEEIDYGDRAYQLYPPKPKRPDGYVEPGRSGWGGIPRKPWREIQ